MMGRVQAKGVFYRLGNGALRLAEPLVNGMKGKAKFSVILAAALALSGVDALWADGLGFGHVRARTRGWTEEEFDGSAPIETSKDLIAEETIYDDAPLPELEREFTEDVLPMDEPEEPVEAFEDEIVEEEVRSERPKSDGIGKRVVRSISGTVQNSVRATVQTGKNGLKLIQRRERGPNPENGYLVMGGATPLRFSDVDPVDSRPPAPALPEFSFSSNGYDPYLLETALPEDAMNDNSLLSEIVIELEPHEIVSGKIDTRIMTQQDSVETFSVDDKSSSVLRPEEILIYFEKDTASGKTGVMVPFEPSKGTADPVMKSSATLKKE